MQPLVNFLATLPLELFVIIGAFAEELISPIPSVAILTPAGAAAAAQQSPGWYVGVLAILAAIARVPAALLLYQIAFTAHAGLFAKRRRWLRVTRADIQKLHNLLSTRHSLWILFGMWALPIFPGAGLSLVCGFLRAPRRYFIAATFFGSIINALFYLYIGYVGLQAFSGFATLELYGQLTVALLLVLSIAVWVRRRKR